MGIWGKHPRGGFTLVEVMIGVFIFAMVIAGGLITVSKGFELVDNARHHTRASQILQSEIELLRTRPWKTLKGEDSSSLSTQFKQQIEAQFSDGSYAAYTGDANNPPTVVADFSTTPAEVTVSVSWRNRLGRLYTKSYTTYFTEGGVNDYYITKK
jgi:prepilin-type N-terminal cleavage/methylation domain-containing protein